MAGRRSRNARGRGRLGKIRPTRKGAAGPVAGAREAPRSFRIRYERTLIPPRPKLARANTSATSCLRTSANSAGDERRARRFSDDASVRSGRSGPVQRTARRARQRSSPASDFRQGGPGNWVALSVFVRGAYSDGTQVPGPSYGGL